jgi:hypothetical protein
MIEDATVASRPPSKKETAVCLLVIGIEPMISSLLVMRFTTKPNKLGHGIYTPDRT